MPSTCRVKFPLDIISFLTAKSVPSGFTSRMSSRIKPVLCAYTHEIADYKSIVKVIPYEDISE
ncbi:MAG: hypothetical protein HKUEN01_03480 [Candidatus Kuenenia stuttgartiensis]|nr:hypothetical protein [Chitinophagaceae bacterium]GJQ47962.1 MAG: hypothetical protein HKUEN01_03480 [Candidatus Kuenenia stuttgartiensis]